MTNRSWDRSLLGLSLAAVLLFQSPQLLGELGQRIFDQSGGDCQISDERNMVTRPGARSHG